MIVSDLSNVQVAGHTKRVSQRKHEGVRTPTARNAIVRDRETNLYYARYDSSLVDSDNTVNLRLNALELNQHILLERGVIHQPADTKTPAPFASNVVPMADARKAKEQSKAAQAPPAIPKTQVNGNVALALPAPKPVIPVPEEEAPPTQPPLEFTGKHQELKYIGKDILTASEDVSKQTEDILAAVILPEDRGLVDQLADAYGMDLVEASEILCREFFFREDQCMKHHETPRIDVKNARYKAKEGMYVPKLELIPYGMRRSAEASGFKAWSREMRSREIALVGNAARRLADPGPTQPAPYTEGEMAYRKKQVIKRAAARPRLLPPGASRVEQVAKKLRHEPPVTTASQVKAITTWSWDVYQKGRKLLGMQPTLRNKTKRLRYELMDEVNMAEAKRAKAASKVTVPCDDSTSQAELVRRYRRVGIGY